MVSGAFYYRLDVCNLCKLLFQTQFLSIIILFYLYNNIPQVNNKCIISCNHLTKLLKWSRHYVEIRQGQRCNHIWVTDTCYYVITVNAKITRKFNTFLFIFFLCPPWAKINIFNKFVSIKYAQYTYNNCRMGKYMY